MAETIELGDITVEVVKKDIRNVHLSVYPPTGRVRISAPAQMSLDTIRVFAISKLGWIKQQQQKLREQERETPREYLDRESHYVWGKRYLLKIVEQDAAPIVSLQHSTLWLQVRPGTDEARKQAVVAEWYREQLKASRASVDRKMGAADGREGGAVLRAAHENAVGKLQPQCRQHPPQLGTGQEAARMSGVHRGA